MPVFCTPTLSAIFCSGSPSRAWFKPSGPRRSCDEMFAALKRDRPDLDPTKLDRTRALMATAVGDWKVINYEPLIDSLKLPDPDDRHVLAAAIRARAQVIVTSNLKDFPAADLAQWDIEPKSPDGFVRDQMGLDRDAVVSAIQQIADSWRNPQGTPADVLDRLERSGLAVSVAELRVGRR